MRLNYISSKVATSEYAVKTRSSTDTTFFDENLARIFCNDAARELLTADTHKVYMIHKELNHIGKADLGPNFLYPLQVAYRGVSKPDELYYKTTVSQFVQRSVEDACNVTIDINCPKCGNCDCGCSSYPIELEVKDYMLASNPELAQGYSKFLLSYSNSPHGHYTSNLHKGFEIIKPSSSYFHRLPIEIKNCAIPDLQCKVEYTIDNQVLLVNSTDPCGEVLVSYIGARMDEEGFLLVPDDPIALRAITARIMEGFALQQYSMKPGQNTRVYWIDMKQYADREMNRAKSRIRVPDMDEWDELMRNVWNKRIAYDSSKGSGRYEKDDYNPSQQLLG